MKNETPWLTAVAVLSVVGLLLYMLGLRQTGKPFDLDKVVPLCLSAMGAVAAVRMMLLAFTLPSLVKDEHSAVLDLASILVGGLVFLCTTLFGFVTIVIEAFN